MPALTLLGTGDPYPRSSFMSKKQIVQSRQIAYRKQCGRCIYCSLPMWLHTPEELAMPLGLKPSSVKSLQCTAEHLHPKSEGGTQRVSNIAAACKFCNSRRHQRKSPPDPLAYRQMVANRLQRGKWHAPPLIALFLREPSESIALK